MVRMSLDRKGHYVTGKVSPTGRKSHSRSTEATTEKRGKIRTRVEKLAHCCWDKVGAQFV